MRSDSRGHSELACFLTVGAAVAALGQLILSSLLSAGWAGWLANSVQVAVTLQLNFLGNRRFTWCHRLADSGSSGLASWCRFHCARGAGAMVNVAAFPVLAPHLGHSGAYWTLLAAGAVLNFCTDRFWSFGRGHPVARVLCVLGVVAGGAIAAAWYLDAFIVLVSVFMFVVTVTTLGFQLYEWWRPGRAEPDHRGLTDPPRLPGVILVPMRFEEAVAGRTLDRLATLDHPNYLVVPIVDHADDPGTARIAHEKARRYPGRVLVCPYPEDTPVHNKPLGLNTALDHLERSGVRFEWVGVADAEDLFHPDLLRVVDHRFRETNAAVVQSGVQLMNFHTHPDAVPGRHGLRRWWRATTSGWWRAANVLEYFKWFQSRLKLQAAAGVMPLGGNTVFFRRPFLHALRARHGSYWDATCLTEDCKIGILASVLGLRVEVIYSHELVTREETPTTLRGLLRQRVRWMQGFIQVFAAGDWLSLPTLTQRLLAVYVLGFQFFQAFAAAFAPVALALAVWHKSPVVVTLLATVPLGLGVLAVVLDVVLLRQFGRTFGMRARLRDHLGLVVGAYPYQLVLSCAAVWAVLRYAAGRGDWVKTAHAGAHLEPALAVT